MTLIMIFVSDIYHACSQCRVYTDCIKSLESDRNKDKEAKKVEKTKQATRSTRRRGKEQDQVSYPLNEVVRASVK